MKLVLVNNRMMRVAGFVLLAYGAIEVVDCVMVFLMSMGWVENIYPRLVFPPMQNVFDEHPVSLLCLFIFFTVLRLGAGYGVLKNRLWGVGMAVVVTASTIIFIPFWLPASCGDALFNLVVIIALLLGYFGKRKACSL